VTEEMGINLGILLLGRRRGQSDSDARDDNIRATTTKLSNIMKMVWESYYFR
jgi:hypothetical protein